MKIKNIFIALFLTIAFSRAENSVILKQTDSPLAITNYVATFEPETSGSSYSMHLDQIRHSAAYNNVSGRGIVAIQIGFAAFDAFNNFMGGFSGWSIENIQKDGRNSGEWTQSPYATFGFKKYGTGVAYVKAVRFEDGSIWQADMAEVLSELQKFEKDLKKEDLQEKKK